MIRPMIRSTMIACGLLILAPAAQAETAFPDLSYGTGVRNLLDLHLPEAEHPGLVLYIHGGAWFRGDKDQVEDYARLQAMLDAGLAVATMNYTWSQQQTWPAQEQDIASAHLTVDGGGHGGDGFDAMVAPSLQFILDAIGPDR